MKLTFFLQKNPRSATIGDAPANKQFSNLLGALPSRTRPPAGHFFKNNWFYHHKTHFFEPRNRRDRPGPLLRRSFISSRGPRNIRFRPRIFFHINSSIFLSCRWPSRAKSEQVPFLGSILLKPLKFQWRFFFGVKLSHPVGMLPSRTRPPTGHFFQKQLVLPS